MERKFFYTYYFSLSFFFARAYTLIAGDNSLQHRNPVTAQVKVGTHSYCSQPRPFLSVANSLARLLREHAFRAVRE